MGNNRRVVWSRIKAVYIRLMPGPGVPGRLPLRELSRRTSALIVVSALLVGGGLAAWGFSAFATRLIAGGFASPIDQAAATLRLDALKTGLTVAAGLGAAATLLLALRRQSIAERTQRFTEDNAEEERITALYVAAASQIGNDKAAVRLAGMYSLERLAQDHPRLRQTVVDVICAYLRMPFKPPVSVLSQASPASPKHLPSDEENLDAEQDDDRMQELQVRFTAQSILAEHLSTSSGASPPASFWLDATGDRMKLKLNGATLVSFSLVGCAVESIELRAANCYGTTEISISHFYGDAHLQNAQFHGPVSLVGTEIHGKSSMVGAKFYGPAWLTGFKAHSDTFMQNICFYNGLLLDDAEFRGRLDADKAEFHGSTGLCGTHFLQDVSMQEAVFHGYADFSQVHFHEGATLGQIHFHGSLDLKGAEFHSSAYLARNHMHEFADMGAHFGGNANLGEMTFHENADFQSARFSAAADLRDNTFCGEADFRGARFDADLEFYSSKCHGNARFRDVQIGSASFFPARFDRLAFFDNAKFGTASFTDVRFNVHASFIGTDFMQEPDFKQAKAKELKSDNLVLTGDPDAQGLRFIRSLPADPQSR